MKRESVWIGTSGWVYKQWAGNFYPKGWPKKAEFEFYTRHFPTVEINATFYRLPSLAMVRNWHAQAPGNFKFAVKGSRFLTHMKRLTDTGPGLRKYFARMIPLAEHAGPILWQLPPNFRKTDETHERLARFLQRLPTQYRHAVEFRHPSWMDETTMSLLREHQAANVWISSLSMPQNFTATTDFVYLRFHGLKDGAYHDYTDDELRPWAKQLARVARTGREAFVYFNNDLNTRAPLNARALMNQLGPLALPAFTPDDDRQPAASTRRGAQVLRGVLREKKAPRAVQLRTPNQPPSGKRRSHAQQARPLIRTTRAVNNSAGIRQLRRSGLTPSR